MFAAALAGGNKVVATSRNSSKLSFEGGNDENLLKVDLDVTKKDQIGEYQNSIVNSVV